MAKVSPVQALYELCNKTFAISSSPALAGASSPPAASAVRALAALLDTISPAEVGLKDGNVEDDRGLDFFESNIQKNTMRSPRWAQPITYLHIYECDSFSIGIFCFPTASVIPLHDHPGMTVLSKILYGSMHVKSYDWVEPSCWARNVEPDHSQVRLAKLHMDDVIAAPCPTTVLYPKSGGNLHCFSAVTPCAVLDVLAPPYCDEAGRTCTYYRDYPYPTFMPKDENMPNESDEEHAWIEALDGPKNLYVRSGRYSGPNVQEDFCFPGTCTVV